LSVTDLRIAGALNVGPLSRNVGTLNINLGCVTSQKSVDLIYAATEANNQANTLLLGSNRRPSEVWKFHLHKPKK